METKLWVYAIVVTVVLQLVSPANAATGYTNHTVGDSIGWFFNATTNTTATNYSAWAAAQSFNLGDYLMFKTNTNQTVIQTYNETTYRSCSFDDGSDDDTFEFNGGSNQFGEALTIPVPLTTEGKQYYFSDADDGVQCLNGMAFEINVRRGLGLPPSLNQPPPPPHVEPPSQADGIDSPPVTVLPNPPIGVASARGSNLRRGFCLLLAMVFYLSGRM